MNKKPYQKRQAGLAFDCHVVEYLDSLREIGPFRKLSRSALVNYIIEEYARGQGTPLFDKGADARKFAQLAASGS